MTSLFPSPCPLLPPFQTLLIKGSYHASAPIHLCLSHRFQLAPTKAVLLAPSRELLVAALTEFDDDWLNKHGAEGRTCNVARNIDILYPPTLSHLSLLLSMLHKMQSADREYFNAKTTFDMTPSLVVVTELSSYFDAHNASITSYLDVISHSLASIASLSAHSDKPTSLVVFDSGLDQLRLPLLPNLSLESESLEPDESDSNSSRDRLQPVAFLVHRYFEWVGVFHKESEELGQSDDEASASRVHGRLQLQRLQGSRDGEEVVWEWSELAESNRSRSFYWTVV